MKNIYDIRAFGAITASDGIQTKAIQAALDEAAKAGGTVIVPKGKFITGGLRMYGNTELFLKDGASLLGSTEPEDYPVFDIPEGVTLHTDMVLLAAYFTGRNIIRDEYRRALITAYGADNIAIRGEGKNSVIDGRDCFDPEGEEGMRGPHGIFFSNCRGVTLENYTIQNCGNFHHQIDTSSDVSVSGVTALAGHDGFHLHFCQNVSITECTVHTGDDCIAGINMENLTVNDCDLNSSCQIFRIGGKHILVENCHGFGPGIYPYRRSIVIDRDHSLPLSEGHHALHSFIQYFSSKSFPRDGAYDIVLRNCSFENAGKLLVYQYDKHSQNGCNFHSGTPFLDLTFDSVTVSGLREKELIKGVKETPLRITFKNTTLTDESGKEIDPFTEDSENIEIEII